jgi:hypothetical protein
VRINLPAAILLIAASSVWAQNPTPASDDQWHVTVSPYLWFPGMHGTVGTPDRQLSVHESAIDILSNFRFGLMGEADMRYKRLVLPIDMMWVRLGDDKTLSNLGQSGTTADVKITEFILTPKIGYRLIDQEKFKLDALTGFRYWHLGQNLRFDPSRLGLDFSGSQNWVDPLVGGRIQMPLSPKMEITIAGDVGGWGAGSELEYQLVGLLGYRIKPKCALQVGWRYLDVNYRSGKSIFDVASSGLVFGATFDLK